MPPKHDKRKEDTMFYKVSRLAAVITAVGIIAGGTVKVLSYEFVKKDDLKSLTACDVALQERCVAFEKDQTRVVQKLDDVASDVKDIKNFIMHKGK
jgi:hypothetical protein